MVKVKIRLWYFCGQIKSIYFDDIFREKNKEKVLFSTENSTFLVGVPGFEPGASWTRTKRDTKLRHTPIVTATLL